MDIKDFKEFKNNPRTLSKKQHDQLKRDLLELGDLSGIVHDLNSGEIVGGNQRVKIFCEIPNPKITISERYKNPTKAGTVAHGYVELNSEKYSYREVRWTPKQCQKANIVANKAGGEWDFSVLKSVFKKNDLIDWGFEKIDLGIGDETIIEDEGKEKFSIEINECPKCGYKWKSNEQV